MALANGEEAAQYVRGLTRPFQALPSPFAAGVCCKGEFGSGAHLKQCIIYAGTIMPRDTPHCTFQGLDWTLTATGL